MIPNENNLTGKYRISELLGHIEGRSKGAKRWVNANVDESAKAKELNESLDVIIEAQDEIFKILQSS